MFVGAIPLEFVSQLLDAVPFAEWGMVHVCCSGSFRPEIALRQRFPELWIIGNDVSLLSVAVGKLAVAEPLEFRFKERLEAFEEKLAGAEQLDRVAAVLIAHEMATWRGSNTHAKAVFAHYLANFDKFLAASRKKISEIVRELRSDGFFAGDFQLHAAHAIEANAGVLAFCPTYFRGYERIYKFLGDNVVWEQPVYEMWNPAGLHDWLLGLVQQGARYCVIGDQRFEDMPPSVRYDSGSGRKSLFAYLDAGRSSLRGKPANATPFEYQRLDPWTCRADSKVTLVPLDAGHATFLKNRYLAKGIKHTTGQLNFGVLVDGALAGAFIYSRSTFNPEHDLYLLSDFSVSAERRLSKLVAMLATSRMTVDVARKKFLSPLSAVETTAFTDRPVSMKYRGVFDLKSRKPGALQYRSVVRESSPGEIYAEWYRRWAGGETRDADKARSARAA